MSTKHTHTQHASTKGASTKAEESAVVLLADALDELIANWKERGGCWAEAAEELYQAAHPKNVQGMRWHVFAGTGDTGMIWQAVAVGPTTLGADSLVAGTEYSGLADEGADPDSFRVRDLRAPHLVEGRMPWVASFDHEPTHEDLDGLEPAKREGRRALRLTQVDGEVTGIEMLVGGEGGEVQRFDIHSDEMGQFATDLLGRASGKFNESHEEGER